MKQIWNRIVSLMAAASICIASVGSMTVQASETERMYQVTIEKQEHGAVHLEKENSCYAAGEKVNVTMTPEEGYTLSELLVATESKQPVKTTKVKTGLSFDMPAENVRLTAIFVKGDKAVTEAESKAETDRTTEPERKPETEPVTEAKSEQAKETETEEKKEKTTESTTKAKAEAAAKPVTETEVKTVPEKETQVLTEQKERQDYTKTFQAATDGGTLRILDRKGNLLKVLSGGQKVSYQYPNPDSPEEVTVLAVAKEGYVVESYLTKWFAGGTAYVIPESLENIQEKEYTRGHYLSTAEFDEMFEVSFIKDDRKQVKTFATEKAARATGDIDNPKEGDSFTGRATVYYSGASNVAYNGTGYIVCTSGDFKGESITMSTCASGHDFAAPSTGQTGDYTVTVTSVDTQRGLVTVSVYWQNDNNTSGYQNLSGTYTYEQNFDGTLKVSKATTDADFKACNYTSSFKKNLDLSATFGIYSDEKATKLVRKVKTDKNGDMIKDGVELEAGTYFVQEITPPTGFALNSVIKKVTVGAGTTRTVTIKDSVLRAKVAGKKIDALTGSSTPTAGLSLAGAVYGVFEDSACTKKVTTGTTDVKGNIEFELPYFAYGTYFIKELTPPPGYDLDDKVYKAVVDESLGVKDDSVYRLNDYTFTSEEPPEGGKAQVMKISSNKGISEGNQCYSLEGCKFKLTNVKTGEEFPEILVTKADGLTQVVELPVGQYSAVEIEAPKGFKLNTEPVIIKVESGKTSVINFADEPANDPVGVLLKKFDAETGNEVKTGAGELKGAEYTFKYYDDQYVSESALNGIVPTRSWVLATDDEGMIILKAATKISGDDFYVNEAGDRVVPLGTLTVQETKAPTGYKLDPTLHIRNISVEDGTGEFIKTYQTVTTPESIKRGDLKAIKVSNGDLKRMADVPFRITSITTGENHVVVTNENGEFNTSSAWNPHGQNTNRGESSEDGVWFGNIDALDESVGALPYDTYRIEELPCEANEDKVLLEPFEIKVFRDLATVDLGTLTNDYKDVPQIGTTATDQDTGNHTGYISPITTIVDLVEYAGLESGKEYTLQGTLMDKETGKELLVDGKPVAAEKTFNPVRSEGSVEMKFAFGSSALAGKAVVVFESLQLAGKEVAVHADIKDEGQTVVFEEPKIGTVARDQSTGSQIGHISKATTIIDTVTYSGLAAGKEYVLQGTLMDKKTGKEFLVEGKPVTSEKTFKPKSTDGSVEMEFTFDSTALAGKAVVVFESLYLNEKEAAAHADIHDKGQTVSFEEVTIGTTAVDQETGGHVGHVSQTTTIKDTVAYSGLIPGKEYTLKGVLMNKNTGKKLKINGKEVSAEKTFKPQKADSSVEMEFTFDSTALAGKAVVVFENLYQDEMEIAVHADINDKGQSVTFEKVEIGTKANEKGTGKKELNASKKVTILDIVTYSGLIPGKKYTVKGILMDKETGRELLIGGQTVTAEKAFKPEKSKGSLEMEFTIDASGMKGKEVVVFEELFYNGRKIAAHADIKDAAQTVKFVETEQPKTPTPTKTPVNPPKTGDTSNLLMYGVLFAGAGTIICVNVHKRRKRKPLK